MENFYTTVQTSSGQVVNGATVTVYDASSGLPATIYEPDGVTPLANPFLSGYARSEGEVEFGAVNGQYNIKIVNGAEIDWIYRITLLDASGFAFGALAYENDASGVPIADSGGYYTSADVEGALQESGADLAAHIADITDAHAASAISIVDAGGLYSSTDVEGALQEVAALPPAYAYFAENRNITAPNATVPVHQWIVDGVETNIDIALTPKGTGAILAQVPDNTSTGGNKRGQYAVDLQTDRASAAQVASGDHSAILSGYDNTASGQASIVIGGGSGNVASGNQSVIAGALNTASDVNSAVLSGQGNAVSGRESVIAGGWSNSLSGQYSYCFGGAYASDRGLYGKGVVASGRFTIRGDSQLGRQITRYTTSDATPTIITTDGLTASTTNVPVLPDNHAYAITARIIGRDTSTGDIYHIKVEGTATRGSGAATTALVGTPTYTTISQSAGASTWSVALVANTTRGSAEIQVTGAAATTIHWVCEFNTVEAG